MTDIIPTILVCIDTTNASAVTLRYACLKAKKQEKRKQLEKYLQNLINEMQKEIAIIPVVSIREGDISSEILNEIKSMPSCMMLIFGKSHNSKSDNTVLPKIAQKIGTKIRIPIVIVPENLDEELCKLMV